jgi:hypothetical protein
MSHLTARLIALPALAAGGGIFWYFGPHALAEAEARAPSVDFGAKGLFLAALLVVAGAYLLLGGPPVLRAFSGPPKGRQAHLIVWSMFALGCLLGIGAWWLLRERLHGLGYSIA